MVTKKIVTLSILSLVLFCGAIDAASAKYPTHSNNVFGRLSESLSDAIQHPVQAVQEVKRFAVAPFSKWFGGYDEQEQYHERMEDSSWGNRNFDFMFSSEVDERDPNHPKYHVDIDIDVEKPSYLEIMRQVTESMYEGGDKYVTQKVVVTEKIPARDRYGRGIEEVRPSKIEEPEEEGEASSRRYLRSEGYGTHEKPRYKEHARQGNEESWTDSLKQKGHEIKEDVKEAAKKVREKAERPLRETAERVKEGVKEGLETAEEKIEDFGDKLKEAEERVVETGEDIRRGLGETLKGVGRKIIGAEEKVRHGFEDKLEDVEDSLKDTARAFTDKAHKLKDKTQHIGHKFTDAVHNVEDKAKSTLQNVENMANQIRQNVEDNARGLASMLYYPVKEFKQWLTGGAKSVGEFVNKETNTAKRTAHEMKNAIARQGEKIKIPPISEKLCDAGQSLLDSVCGGRHASSEKEFAGHHEQYGSYGTASKHWDRDPQQEGRRYHGFVEEEEPSYGRKHGHSDQVEEEICRPVYARTL